MLLLRPRLPWAPTSHTLHHMAAVATMHNPTPGKHVFRGVQRHCWVSRDSHGCMHRCWLVSTKRVMPCRPLPWPASSCKAWSNDVAIQVQGHAHQQQLHCTLQHQCRLHGQCEGPVRYNCSWGASVELSHARHCKELPGSCHGMPPSDLGVMAAWPEVCDAPNGGTCLARCGEPTFRVSGHHQHDLSE